MVNERYEGEGHEEGEYHFSDDQANYDMEVDSAKESAVAVAPKESVAEKLKQHRRIVIGILVFIILIGIVYKLVAPSSTPATDFQAGADQSIKRSTTKAATPSNPAPAQSPVAETAMTQPATPAPTTSQPPATQPAIVATTTQPPVAAPVQPTLPAPVLTETMPQQPVAAQPPPPIPVPAANILDRVTTLEQQNSAMMNLLQTQYTQKIADTESQNTQLRTQVQELTARISNMEVAFRQLTKILQNNVSTGAIAGIPNRGIMNAPTAARVIQPKISYTVQAIIPGRAWLKSDSGDTVTVAEGDMLKGYGRITKIDPYDGIVDIDTGSRILTL